MKIDLVFLIVISIVIAYLFVLYKVDCNSDKIEKMADIGTVDQIKDAVRQVYQADVEAIRNLSNVATQLQAGGITVPGQLKVGGKLSTNNLDPSNMPDGWGGGLRIFDGYASGTMGFGPDGKKLNAYINSGGAIVGIDATIANNLTSTNLTSTNINGININASNKTNEGGSISIKNELKNGKANQTNSWTIWNMTGDYGNKLSFWRYNGDGVNAGPALDLFDDGTVNVPGNLKVGDVVLTPDILKRIINQQQCAGFAVNGGGTTMPLFEGDYLLTGGGNFDAWTNDSWDVIYINRGWRITLWDNGIGDTEIASGENRSSYVPTKMVIPSDRASSYRAVWIGY